MNETRDLKYQLDVSVFIFDYFKIKDNVMASLNVKNKSSAH